MLAVGPNSTKLLILLKTCNSFFALTYRYLFTVKKRGSKWYFGRIRTNESLITKR